MKTFYLNCITATCILLSPILHAADNIIYLPVNTIFFYRKACKSRQTPYYERVSFNLICYWVFLYIIVKTGPKSLTMNNEEYTPNSAGLRTSMLHLFVGYLGAGSDQSD